MSSSSLPQRPPSSRWYRLAGAIAALGIIGALAWWPYAATRVHDAVYDFERVSAFGGKVDLAAGRHTVWLEGNCLSCRGNEPAEYREVADLDIRPLSGGDRLAPRASPDRWVYNTGAREGRAIYFLDVPAPGSYAVRFSLDTSSPEWDNDPPAALAFGAGEGLPVPIARPIVLLGGGGVGLALTVALVTLFRRWHFYERRYPVSAR